MYPTIGCKVTGKSWVMIFMLKANFGPEWPNPWKLVRPLGSGLPNACFHLSYTLGTKSSVY